MGWSRGTRLLMAGVAGAAATLIFYFVLLVVQIANADDACESYPQTVPGADFQDVRGIGFENSLLNLGGRCTYRMDDGPVVVTVFFARRKGHPGLLFGLTGLLAPPLGFALAGAALRRA